MIDFFAVGMLAAVLVESGRRVRLPLVLGFGLVAAAFAFETSDGLLRPHHPAVLAADLAVAAGFALIVLAVAQGSRVFSARPLVWLGMVSYGILPLARDRDQGPRATTRAGRLTGGDARLGGDRGGLLASARPRLVGDRRAPGDGLGEKAAVATVDSERRTGSSRP